MIAQWTRTLFSMTLRGTVVAFIWFMTVAILHVVNMTVWGGVNEEITYWAAVAMMVPSAYIVSRYVLDFEFAGKVPRRQQGQSQTVADRFTNHDLIAMLSDDDLDDLREEVRESLRRRIRRLSDDEPESFGDLITEMNTKRKRGAR